MGHHRFPGGIGKVSICHEWQWHDFLRDQVKCRSIKNICDVTRIDPQVVLMNLLQEERANTLRTKGPYNSMFGRRSEDGGGFAIDEPTGLITMLASGFVVLKVVNEKGEHLICLEVRKGVDGVAILTNADDSSAAALNIGKDDLQVAFDNRSVRTERAGWSKLNRFGRRKQEKVIRLSWNDMRYTKVLGIYIRDSKLG